MMRLVSVDCDSGVIAAEGVEELAPELAMVFLIFLPRLLVGSAPHGFRLASREPAFPVPRQLKGRRAQPVLARAPAGTMCQALGCC